jgi:hypothetical protein
VCFSLEVNLIKSLFDNKQPVLHKNPTLLNSCSFCHNTNHNISNCKNKKSLITTANGRVIETYDEIETFTNYMRTGPRDLLDYNKTEISIYKGLPRRTIKNKYTVVHNSYPKENKEIIKQHWNLCDMIFCISLVQYDGTIDLLIIKYWYQVMNLKHLMVTDEHHLVL